MPDSIDVFTVCVNTRTSWIFFRLSGSTGESGIGEATVPRCIEETLQAIPSAMRACNGCKSGLGAKLDAVRAACPVPVGQAIASALEQAWLDRFAKESGCPLHLLLGGLYRSSVPTYANINRGTLTRKPDEFALRAQAAVDNGYTTVKLAPFDDVMPVTTTSCVQTENERSILIEKGLERVAAVAEQVGKQAAVQVDCHSRLRMDETGNVIDSLADLGVTWFEEPVSESSDMFDNIVAIRTHANASGMLLAGAENSPGLSSIANIMRAECYDIVMPDIILAGGPSEVVRMGHLARVSNCAVSLHNPCGPVMDTMSAQVAAALPALHSLERQYDESPLYEEVIERQHSIIDGNYVLADVPGAGCSLVCSHPMVRQVASYAIDI